MDALEALTEAYTEVVGSTPDGSAQEILADIATWANSDDVFSAASELRYLSRILFGAFGRLTRGN
jgi:hypothetical protein